MNVDILRRVIGQTTKTLRSAEAVLHVRLLLMPQRATEIWPCRNIAAFTLNKQTIPQSSRRAAQAASCGET